MPRTGAQYTLNKYLLNNLVGYNAFPSLGKPKKGDNLCFIPDSKGMSRWLWYSQENTFVRELGPQETDADVEMLSSVAVVAYSAASWWLTQKLSLN